MLVERYSLVAFDLDGTLVHTTPDYRNFIVPEVLKKLGSNLKLTPQAINKFWFEGNRNEIISTYFGVDSDLFWKYFHKMDKIENRSKYTKVYEDVHEVISKLHDIGKKLAITTGAPKHIARMETELLAHEKFDKITSITSSRYPAKPNPQSLIGTLKFTKINARETVYVGNSTEDGEYANAAGVDFIFLDRKEHEIFAPKLKTIHTLRELIK